MNSPSLYAVCLGGRAPGARVELHDVAFVVGPALGDCHEQLLATWFGDPDGLHVDAFARLDAVDGHRIEVCRERRAGDRRLYFVNIGGYEPGEFGERHAWSFFVGRDRSEVKARARRELLPGKTSVHRDDLYDIDDVIAVEAEGWHVHVSPDPAAGAPEIVNGYFPLPRATIEAWKASRSA